MTRSPPRGLGTALRDLRRRRLPGLATLLGLGRFGFFIPYRYAAGLPAPGTRKPYAAAEALFESERASFAELLRGLSRYEAELKAIEAAPPGDGRVAARWDQDWFPRLDAAAAYLMVRRRAPKTLVEVGSGHSTRFFARAICDGGLATTLIAVDPEPRASLESLGVVHRRQLAEEVFAASDSPFAALRGGDILAIDSSHLLLPGSDVDLLLGHVLPALPAGVAIHIHDIFLPDDYPADWAWRGYGEQLAVLQLLLGGAYRPLFASHYVATRMAAAVRDSLAGSLPLRLGARESSLWLQKER